jgi:hypothetical protein
MISTTSWCAPSAVRPSTSSRSRSIVKWLRTLVERCVELRWRREVHRQNLKRLETEMAEARAFQQSLLPARDAIVNRVAVCCRYAPCSGLGGDLYDYAAATEGQTALSASLTNRWREPARFNA